ncbi:MAG TPA: hypothetical protein VF359_11165 [Anaerolineales bacterium]
MNMKDNIIIALVVLGISLFFGFVVIAAGLGNFIPPLNQVAKPIVCGSGELQVVPHVYSYKPGSTSYTITIYCIDGTTGVKKDVTNLAKSVIGLLSSAILFVPILFFVLRGINKLRQQQATGNY